MTPLELAARKNKGGKLLPVFLDAIERFERIQSQKPMISFSSLHESDEDHNFITSLLPPNAELSVLLRRWTDDCDADRFFRSWAEIHTPSASRILVKESMYFGSMLLDGNAGIYHAVDFARLDGDTSSFILDDRKSCFYVDIVDDFDFVGIEAKFWGDIVKEIADIPVIIPKTV